ncbi:MAG TPA: hypothetical protein VFG81_03420 [Anaerolineales bacterium]|jgi:hypothetical protein|nr:hypothetical protein [Anaerolineales bacterium]
MRRFPWFEIILIVVVMSMSLYAALSDGQNLSWRWFTRDDAYYYFKVAQNISEGHGSTFDGINRTNGYHPLWMLICIPIFALARFDLILPLRILLLVMSGLSVATAILLYRLIGRIFAPAIGAMAALFWVFSHDVFVMLYQQGLESGIAAFFIVLLVYKLYQFELSWRHEEVSSKQIAILAAIAALTMFSRLDLVFLAAMVGLWIVFRGHLLRFFLPLDIASIIILTILAFMVRVGLTGYYESVDIALLMAALALLVKIPCAYLLGLYQHFGVSRVGELLKRVIVFAVIGSGLTGILVLLIQRLGLVEGSFSRIIILIDLGFTLLFFGISRLIFWGLQTDTSSSFDPNEKPLVYFRNHWKQWLRDGALYYGIVLGALGIYMFWSKLVFGTTSPVSGQIKQWWASLPGRAYGGASREILSFFGLSYRTEENAWNPVSRIFGSWAENMYRILKIEDSWRYVMILTLAAILFYLILFIHRKRAKSALTQMSIIPLLGGAWLQVLYYNALKYAAHKEWYWVSQLVIIVLTVSLVIGMLYTLMRRVPYRSIFAWLVAAYVGVSMGASFWKTIRISMPYHHWPADAAYMDIVPLLEERTEPGSIIGLTGGGNVGYFIHDRTIVNMDGLINSYDYFQALQAHTGGVYLQNIGLDYVLANPVILDQQPYKGQFNEYLEPLQVYYGGKQLMHFRTPPQE